MWGQKVYSDSARLFLLHGFETFAESDGSRNGRKRLGSALIDVMPEIHWCSLAAIYERKGALTQQYRRTKRHIRRFHCLGISLSFTDYHLSFYLSTFKHLSTTMRSNILFTSLPLLLVAVIGINALPMPANIEVKTPPPYLPPQPHFDPGFDAGGLSKKDRRSNGAGADPYMPDDGRVTGPTTGPGGVPHLGRR